jgi:hypothetical protein
LAPNSGVWSGVEFRPRIRPEFRHMFPNSSHTVARFRPPTLRNREETKPNASFCSPSSPSRTTPQAAAETDQREGERRREEGERRREASRRRLALWRRQGNDTMFISCTLLISCRSRRSYSHTDVHRAACPAEP